MKTRLSAVAMKCSRRGRKRSMLEQVNRVCSKRRRLVVRVIIKRHVRVKIFGSVAERMTVLGSMSQAFCDEEVRRGRQGWFVLGF